MFVQQRRNARLAQVKVHQQRFVADKTINARHIGREIGFTIARFSRSNQHRNRSFALRNRFETRTNATQRLGECRFGALRRKYRMFAVGFGVPNATNEREIARNFLNIFFGTNGEVEQFAQHKEGDRHKQSEQTVSGVGFRGGTAIHHAANARRLQHRVVRHIRGLTNLRLAAFLQQKSVVTIVDFVLALHVYHGILLFGQLFALGNGTIVLFFVIFQIEIVDATHIAKHLEQHVAHLLHLLGIASVVRVFLANFGAIELQFVVLTHQIEQRGIRHTNACGRNQHIFHNVIFQIIRQIVEIALFLIEFHFAVGQGRELRHHIAHVTIHINDVVFATIGTQTPFRFREIDRNYLQLIVDKIDGANGLCVFALEVVVDEFLRQHIQEIGIASGLGANQRNAKHR